MRVLHPAPFTRVLVVCVGNVCRSPMGAALLADSFARRGIEATVQSAGIAALEGRPAEPIAHALMRERGLDISAHRARQLTPELVSTFELLLVMEKRQERAVESIAPSARGRVHRIGRFGDFDVPDPYREGRAEFERALALIERGLAEFERAFWSAPG